MNTPRITLSGADERTSLADLVRLADAAEIALLYTFSPDGRNRYPHLGWIVDAAQALAGRAAIHVCGGRALTSLLRGDLDGLLAGVKRIQVNGALLSSSLIMLCEAYPAHTIITQHRAGNAWLAGPPNHALLVDASGGRGLLPPAWERPTTPKQVGFAGGLTPDNLAEQLPRIAAVASGEWWIDLEAGLRDGSDWFSVDKAARVIDLWQKFQETNA